MPINSVILTIHLLGSNHSDTKALPPTPLFNDLTHIFPFQKATTHQRSSRSCKRELLDDEKSHVFLGTTCRHSITVLRLTMIPMFYTSSDPIISDFCATRKGEENTDNGSDGTEVLFACPDCPFKPFRKIYSVGYQPVFCAVYPVDALIASRGRSGYCKGAFRRHSFILWYSTWPQLPSRMFFFICGMENRTCRGIVGRGHKSFRTKDRHLSILFYFSFSIDPSTGRLWIPAGPQWDDAWGETLKQLVKYRQCQNFWFVLPGIAFNMDNQVRVWEQTCREELRSSRRFSGWGSEDLQRLVQEGGCFVRYRARNVAHGGLD